MQKMKFYLHNGFGDPTVSYTGTIIFPFQGMCQDNGILPSVWLLFIFVLVVYLKASLCGVEIKTSFTGDVFKLMFMMSIGDGDFLTLVNETDRIWYELDQQHQMTVQYCSRGLNVSGGL